ncbi:hypothetical protein BGZ51_008015 [Haplosporangium sp. Z 767]|nr:hypothetical protein BGZ50_008126 [Haplosporangium sp. Z 11]KAF9178237.1 hypothetical protein BGZ51_008015 [Haplosporangium sp. Z 767]
MAYFYLRGSSPLLFEIRSSTNENAAKGPSKVQSLARRYSAMAKQASEPNYVPQNNLTKPVQTGKVSSLLSKSNSSTAPSTSIETAPVSTDSAPPAKAPEVIQEQEVTVEEPLDVEKEIESSLHVADLSEKVKEIDIKEVDEKEAEQQDDESKISAESQAVIEEPVEAEEQKEAEKEPEQQSAVAETTADEVDDKEQENVVVEENNVNNSNQAEEKEEKEEDVKPVVEEVTPEETPKAVEIKEEDVKSSDAVEEQEVKSA